ncbi:probable methyltransferase TARBP1 [Uloborus diversus]|uniref:probable methyltransferase TARBP1 n=1 Tax=Uloborus diversus TaxID=327109 RepID=UPI00240A04B4|nr:probable methyltransferase TARBP1 [Uloborus diversus]
MENSDLDIEFILGKFCDKQLVLKYFANIRESLLIIDKHSAVDSLRKFRKCLLFFESTHMLSSDYLIVYDHGSDNIDIETVNDMLLSILEILSEHIISVIKKIETDTSQEFYNGLFETVVLLLRILLNHRKSVQYHKLLFENLRLYFNEYTVECEKFSSEIQNEEFCFYNATLHFFLQILKIIPIDSRNIYVSNEALINTVRIFCLSDRQTMNFFISSLLPSILNVSDNELKTGILSTVWNFISSHFPSWETKPGRMSCLYSLLCCLSEFTFQMDEVGDCCIYEDSMFWKLIQCGLSSSESYMRKQCLYVFKLLLALLDKENKKINVLEDGIPFFQWSSTCISIWADVITLFETLEEKQVHIIKPVLPKFERLVSLTVKETTSSFAFTLHTSWIICIIKRMLIHESKYITRWSLTTVLNFNFKTCPIQVQNSMVFLKITIEALNDQNLYIRIISSQSWCGVALLHVISALSTVESTPAWNGTDLQFIRKLLIESQETQELAFKYALCHYIVEYNLESFEIRKVAVILTVLSKLTLQSPCSGENNQLLNCSLILDSLLPTCLCLSRRPYMPLTKILNILQLITFLLEESQDVRKDMHNDIIKCFHNVSDIIEFIYNNMFLTISDPTVISHNYIFLNALRAFSRIEEYRSSFLNLVKDFTTKFDNLTDENYFILPTLISFWKILNLHSNYFHSKTTSDSLSLKHLNSLNFHIASNIIAKYDFNKILSCTTFQSKEHKEEWIKIFRESFSDFWIVIHQVLVHFTPSEVSDILLPLSEKAKKGFNEGPASAVVPIIKCLKVIVPNLGKTYLVYMEDLLDVCWKTCLELRGNEKFRPAFKSFVEVILQPEMFQEIFFNILYKYIENFKQLSENCAGIFYIAVKQFCVTFKLANLMNLQFDYVPFLSFALTYGPIHHKGQRILEETLVYMAEHCNFDIGSSYDVNKPLFFVRLTTIMYLLENLAEISKKNENIAILMINDLIDMDKKVALSRSSRFANSFCHRLRNRIWQSVMLLQTSLVSDELNQNLVFTILDILNSENQQPSVRCLQEWIMIRILISQKIFLKVFVDYFEKSSEKRPSHLISLLSILNHVFPHVDETEWALLKCFPVIIRFCMAQNFNVRLHARLTLMNCITLCEKDNITTILEKYDYLSEIMTAENSSECGNFSKNLNKLASDFYFSAFHPEKHFSLESIFFDIPRLNNLTSEELIKPSFFKSFSKLTEKSKIPFYNADDILRRSSPTIWTSKPIEKNLCENSVVDFNFQKKICPWKDGLNQQFGKLDIGDSNRNTEEGLIVIASLIDRIPNLGGLCRTCEIFGVKEFVIGCMKYVEDKQFQNLAVSADKWVLIKEIKSYHLKEYLMSLKEKGYTLIGVEQTDNSRKLTKYAFPKNSALLLGHEKEGLPVDLIQMLDVCVEIPQHGVIRSLNVHVSGAILIWEYARQHHFNVS